MLKKEGKRETGPMTSELERSEGTPSYNFFFSLRGESDDGN
jgi:hypothetical protein